MTLRIDWQNEAVGEQTRMRVAILDVELIVSLIGDIIVEASWEIPSGNNAPQTEFAKSMEAYLLNPDRHHLNVRLLRQGSAYRQKIWRALLAIPLGEVISYSALAEKMGSGPRAVAQACKNNPYAGIIPCHRVVAKSGIGGFMGQSRGDMILLKRRLLEYERRAAESAG
ncbi:methylated-DNA--[protein]-cysteine S-methyltransferase [Methylomonas sp. SURF-2]|uniref:Methylated-DNA--[protein]-cysteine S-methyltransferase n=1 Tax=Methylomonas subterranea TaxID=2952225 RepID=A0ABT1TMZ9_9GAMM|nr:methylated-DNA--[protein]-cysteine S-methyltransferase [Methylomonas sp. SURF-2]MCQ8106129.1 methylated-DNA--[protein]-cysteine S-methyltransferase [Methylomonas sp. SURF-2]